jgi:hypothetical protein
MTKRARKTILQGLSVLEELITEAKRKVDWGEPKDPITNYVAMPDHPIGVGGHWAKNDDVIIRSVLIKEYNKVLNGISEARKELR